MEKRKTKQHHPASNSCETILTDEKIQKPKTPVKIFKYSKRASS